MCGKKVSPRCHSPISQSTRTNADSLYLQGHQPNCQRTKPPDQRSNDRCRVSAARGMITGRNVMSTGLGSISEKSSIEHRKRGLRSHLDDPEEETAGCTFLPDSPQENGSLSSLLMTVAAVSSGKATVTISAIPEGSA